MPKEVIQIIHIIWNYKKVITLLMLIVILVFASSCGNKETENLSNDKTEARIEKTSASEELENEAETQPEEEIREAAPEAGSNQTVAVRYGEAFSECVLSVSGDILYNYGSVSEENKFYIAEMPEEGQPLSWNCIELPDHMAIRQLTIDYQGKFHILLMEMGKVMTDGMEFNVPTYEVSYIWTINREGEVERKLDVSDLFAREQRSPTCFVTDLDGNFYFDEEGDILRLEPNSGVTMRWSCNSDRIEAIGRGKSGKMYCIYEDYQGADILELLEEDGIAGMCILLPNYDCKYSSMSAGSDAELLIVNIEGGVSAYADGAHTVEQRISKEDMPASGEEAHIHEILSDGRLWMRVYDKETKGCTFYYIPTVDGGEK